MATFSESHCAKEVDLHDPAVHCQVRLQHTASRADPSVVDQYVHPTECPQGFLHPLEEGGGVGEVQGDHLGGVAWRGGWLDRKVEE